jgi:hypothetical protein
LTLLNSPTHQITIIDVSPLAAFFSHSFSLIVVKLVIHRLRSSVVPTLKRVISYIKAPWRNTVIPNITSLRLRICSFIHLPTQISLFPATPPRFRLAMPQAVPRRVRTHPLDSGLDSPDSQVWSVVAWESKEA